MCGSRHTFSRTETKYFVGATEIPANQLREIPGYRFAELFPHRREGFTLKYGVKPVQIPDRDRIPVAEQKADHLATLGHWKHRRVERGEMTEAQYAAEMAAAERNWSPSSAFAYLVTNATPPQAIDRVIKWERKEKQTMCGAKCRNARGPNCDCICEGKYHGAGMTNSRTRFAASDLDFKPTAEMAANAARGLELREKHGKGGTAVGVARARDIQNRANLSPDTVKRMHSFFSRHEGNQAGGEDDAGYIAWLLWGGDAGKAWAARKAAQIDKSESARGAARKASMARELVGSKGNKRIYLGGPDGSGKYNLYFVQVANTGVPGESPAEDLIELKQFATEAKARSAAQKMLSSRPGAKARFGLEKSINIMLEDARIPAHAYDWQNGVLLVDEAYHDRIVQVLKSYVPWELTRLPKIERVKMSRPGAKASMGKREAVEDVANAMAIGSRKLQGMMQDAQSGQLSLVKRNLGWLRGFADGVEERINKFESTGFSRPGAKAAFAANSVDLWNFLSRNDTSITRQNKNDLALHKKYAKMALSLPDFTPPSHAQHGPSLHTMAKDVLAEIKAWEEQVYRYRNRAPWEASRPGKSSFSESAAWIAKYLPALNQWWRDRTDHPTDLDASSDRWEIEGVLDDVAEHCREAVPREAKPSWYAAALRDVKKLPHSRKGSMKSHFAVKKSVSGTLVTLVPKAKGAGWKSYYAEWPSAKDARVTNHGVLVERDDGRVTLTHTSGQVVSEGTAGFGSMSAIRMSRPGAKARFYTPPVKTGKNGPVTWDNLFVGHLGNGWTLANKGHEVNGDYERVAHIAYGGEVTFAPGFNQARLDPRVKAYIHKLSVEAAQKKSAGEPLGITGSGQGIYARPGAKARFAALDGSYSRIDVRYVFPDGTEDTETMSGPARNAAASAIRRIKAKGIGASAWVIGFRPADPRGRFPAGKVEIWKGEVAEDGRVYERGGSFSRPGAKARFVEGDRVVEDFSWVHKATGRSVSSGGAVPWRTPSERDEWTKRPYFVLYSPRFNQTYGQMYKTRAEAEAALNRSLSSRPGAKANSLTLAQRIAVAYDAKRMALR